MATRKLTLYRAKRDFSKTGEPSGEVAVAPSERLRFVIQKHAARRLHYDLRLELDGVFKSWAVTKGPSLDPSVKRLAVEVEDHPLDYGDFEGTIPHGQYGGGTVQLWDRGYWQPEGSRSAEEMLKSGRLRFELEGERLHGGWVLVRMRNDRAGGERQNWLLIKHRDAFVRPDTGEKAPEEDRSVASGRTMADIAAGKGRRPRPFMLRSARYRPDAVWNSNRGDSPEPVSAVTPGARPVPGAAAPVVKRGRRVARLPRFVKPQLCLLRERPPAGVGWGHEIKFDGYRMQLRVAAGQCALRTRTGIDWTARFGSLARAASVLEDCIIDGEIVALDQHGAPDFAALQAALAEGETDSLIFFAFDLLFCGQEDLRALPLSDRKVRLRALLAHHPQLAAPVRYVEHFASAGDAVLQSACRMSLEGIVSKKLASRYRSGRGQSWLKSRCRAGHEVVIGGWREGAGRVRSLLVGAYRDSHLFYLGCVTTGFKGATSRLRSQLLLHEARRCPFTGRDVPQAGRGVRWLEPVLVAEVEFTGWAEDGLVRQAAFKGLRDDKPASQVRVEKPVARASLSLDAPEPPPQGSRGAPRPNGKASPSASPVVMGVKLTKAEKPLWPATPGEAAITKLDLAHYFEQVGEWMIEHLRGRPCSIIRAPDGIGGQRFFQRHATPGTSSLIELVKVAGDSKPYLQVDRIEGLAALAQVAALELHPWNCAPGQPEVPGRFVFDLDPAPDVPFDGVIEAAAELRERLEKLGLIAFCKTTGGKGLHLVTPFSLSGTATLGWPEAKALAREICVRMAADSPQKYLVTMGKKERTGRIFLDYLRNDRMATAVAPLSPRARTGAPVSMPLRWSQVRRGLDPRRYTVRTAPALLGRSSAWQDYCECER
ncbi:MAG TPA: DNA ligase D, partial [Steroidobacteraceae bacterium]|nr:DNA ligase D [Steroidobacteraceae bacterium]